MREITINVYSFNELSDEVKESAHKNYLTSNECHQIIQDSVNTYYNIARVFADKVGVDMGINISRNEVNYYTPIEHNAYCLKDERSIKAVDTAIAFGEGRATKEQLNTTATAANDAGWDAAWGDMSDDTDEAAAYAAYHTVINKNDAGWVAEYAAEVADSKHENLQQTADICRKYIGDLIIEKTNELLRA